MTAPRTALEEAFNVVWPRVHGKAYEQWSATHTRFRRLLDAEAWTSAAEMLVPANTGWRLSVYSGDNLAHLFPDNPYYQGAASHFGFHADIPALALAAACLKAKEAGDGR